MCEQFPSVDRWLIGIRGGGGDIASQRGTAQLRAEVLQQELGFTVGLALRRFCTHLSS